MGSIFFKSPAIAGLGRAGSSRIFVKMSLIDRPKCKWGELKLTYPDLDSNSTMQAKLRFGFGIGWSSVSSTHIIELGLGLSLDLGLCFLAQAPGNRIESIAPGHITRTSDYGLLEERKRAKSIHSGDFHRGKSLLRKSTLLHAKLFIQSPRSETQNQKSVTYRIHPSRRRWRRRW